MVPKWAKTTPSYHPPPHHHHHHLSQLRLGDIRHVLCVWSHNKPNIHKLLPYTKAVLSEVWRGCVQCNRICIQSTRCTGLPSVPQRYTTVWNGDTHPEQHCHLHVPPLNPMCPQCFHPSRARPFIWRKFPLCGPVCVEKALSCARLAGAEFPSA